MHFQSQIKFFNTPISIDFSLIDRVQNTRHRKRGNTLGMDAETMTNVGDFTISDFMIPGAF
jgi:hypothetical protein